MYRIWKLNSNKRWRNKHKWKTNKYKLAVKNDMKEYIMENFRVNENTIKKHLLQSIKCLNSETNRRNRENKTSRLSYKGRNKTATTNTTTEDNNNSNNRWSIIFLHHKFHRKNPWILPSTASIRIHTTQPIITQTQHRVLCYPPCSEPPARTPTR